MGTFTDNLLKLTDFPFSYSFIGLLALIFGGGVNFGDEQFFNKLGPLLILMGFVATTLSISDPIGRLQKALLVKGEGDILSTRGEHPFGQKVDYLKESALSDELQQKSRELRWKEFDPFYARRREEELRDERKKLESLKVSEVLPRIRIFGPVFGELIILKLIPIHVVMCLVSNFQDYRNKNNELVIPFNHIAWLKKVLERLELIDLHKLAFTIISLKRKAVETTWVTREIDKITSMAYFIIVVATFTYAVLFVPNVIDKFVDTFQGTESVQNEQTQDSEDAAVRNGHILTAKIIIGAFSFVTLGAVLTIFIHRARELRSKSFTTFRFLVLQHAIKIKRDTFEKRLEEIRQFLVDGDWTLAEVEVQRLMEEYNDLIMKEWAVAKEKKISPEEINSKDTEKKIMVTWKNGEMREDAEKKIMIKWKNGEMSVEEIKDVENKAGTEQMENVEQKNKE